MLKHLSCQIQRDPFVLDHLLGVESLAVYTYGYAAPYYIHKNEIIGGSLYQGRWFIPKSLKMFINLLRRL